MYIIFIYYYIYYLYIYLYIYISKIHYLIIHKENTKRNHGPYRFYIFDIDLNQISCLIFTV